MGQEPSHAVLYAGTFSRTLDAKKRVAIPSAWVSGEGQEFHVVPHPVEKFLMVMGREELALWEQRFQQMPLSPAEKRIAIRRFYGAARTVTTDKQGRIVLPEEHCESAALNGEVVFIGARSRFEIWSHAEYSATTAKDEEIYKRAADAVGL